jgi:crotonobetainyl-CoA:carnitine CoA-transferase CaiB-like acyl-CoA transferase
MADVHYKARGFPVELWHEELGRTVTYPGAPFHMHASPWRLRGHAPRLGQHNEEILGELTGEMSSGGVPR